MKKASFTRLNKLFKIYASKRNHKVLLSDKNLLTLINDPKSFIIPVFPHVALLSLIPNEHFMMKDLPFYEVTRLVDSKARQARLEEREKKRQERTLRQAPAASCLSSNFVVCPPTKKRKEPAT